jgi:hypothetical protein
MDNERNFSFTSKILPHLEIAGERNPLSYSSKIELTPNLVQYFPYDIYENTPIIFKITKGQIDFYVSFGGIDEEFVNG